MNAKAHDHQLLLAYRAQARATLGNMVGTVSSWEAMTRSLAELGFPDEAERLRLQLQEVYGTAGDLLGKLAPWKDPQPPVEAEAPVPAPVLVPEEDDEEEPDLGVVSG